MTKGKEILVVSRDGLQKKTIHIILLIREEGEVQGPPAEHESDGECDKKFIYVQQGY
jgi:hypothetical protein